MVYSAPDLLLGGAGFLRGGRSNWVLCFVSTLLLMGCTTASWAQDRQDMGNTFTAPDSAFSLRYSSRFIPCQQKEQSTGDGYYWVPAESCAAYSPVCDGVVAEESTAIACFAYPRDRFTDTRAFEAATFSVETMNHIVTAKACLSGPADQIFSPRPPAKLNGVLFSVFEFGEAGMNQSISGEVYRTFHGGKCYQLGISIAKADAQVFDPPAREFTKGDWHEVNGQLERARDSFRFLK